MMETDDTTLKEAQGIVLKLGQERTKLEDELKEWLSILEKVGTILASQKEYV